MNKLSIFAKLFIGLMVAAGTAVIIHGALRFRPQSILTFVLYLTLISAAAAFFIANTVPVSLVLWLAEGAHPVNTWLEIAHLTVPYYVLSAGVAVIFNGIHNPSIWPSALPLFAVMLLIYASFRR